ncbi:LOW QUALITY PROTEIN: neuron navigator 1-like [Brienomyrus brachyistius]|uniref:LOW QUALITY PROTEIN: neuron navigator 1-like n=1 Tax=Brienomyrus brachyistius TaxID=42636 RepID=UPI0020B19044|nr:LOW QUALITY PROTEIN: neuron navigator 1-like [Brienomyrus brachyistius]
MSGGLHVNAALRTQPCSGIALPRNVAPASQPDARPLGSSIPHPGAQAMLSTRSSSNLSKDLLRSSMQKNQRQLQHHSSASSKAVIGSRSAHSSPRVPRKEALRSKDTLDVPPCILSYAAPRNLKRAANNNCQPGHSWQERIDNHCQQRVVSEAGPSRMRRGALHLWPPAADYTHNRNKFFQNNEFGGFADQEMGALDDVSAIYPMPRSYPLEDGQGSNLAGWRQPSNVNMAAVAPFGYRLQVKRDDFAPMEELGRNSQDFMEVYCEDLGGMLGASVKGRSMELKAEQESNGNTYSQADTKGPGMAAKRGKQGVPQGPPRSELRVFRGGSSEGRLPVPSNLRKQRSLTNLAILTDAEKKMHLYENKWCDDMAKPGGAHLKAGKAKPAGGGGAAPLSRNLSKSEHSLFQGKPKPFSPLAAPSVPGKQSRIPRGPYAEVKPLSKAPDDSKSDDEILSCKAKANGKKPDGPSGESGAKGQGEEGEKPFLKVDPELVVTVLGDLEQLLFSQMLDPESQRKRTVQNVLDLRQNLEDTMSSLRGSQLSQSCLESSVGYDSDETNARSISSMSNRSSPLSWRYGQSSPRLQAGDAPSSTGGGYHGGSGAGQYASHTMPMRSPSRLSHVSRIELVENLDTDDGVKAGYLSDSDLLSKSLHDEDDDDLANGWDESSSISSGLSDGSDNLSSEEFNASSSLNSLPTTPVGSRRNSSVVLRTDAEKRSLVESGLSWYSEDGKGHRKPGAGGYDTGSLKTESASKWRKSRPLDTAGEDAGGKAELKKPQSLGRPGGFKKGRNPPVGVTSPITHTSQSVLKVAAPKSDPKAVDKAKMAVKGAGLQRSCSDAGKERGEPRKPPTGLSRHPTATSFGYKKPPPATGTATVMTAGGVTISSGSATVGKTPKSSGIPIKPMAEGGAGGSCGGGGGRKNSLDVSNCEQGFFSPSSRNNIQYRSLPRPAKSSAMSLTGRPPARPVSSSIDPSLLSLKPAPVPAPSPTTGGPKQKDLCKPTSRAALGPVNQTDREKEKAKAKAVASDSEDRVQKPDSAQMAGEGGLKQLGLRHSSGSKYSELSSPTTPRLLCSKSLGRPPSLAHLDKVNSNSLDSCVSLHDLPPKVPPFSKLQDLADSVPPPRLTPSPAPVLHIDSPSCFSGQALSVGGSPLLYPKLSGFHRSMESLPLQMSVPSSPAPTSDREHERTSAVWSTGSRASLTLPESGQRDRNTLPKKGLSRYSSGQAEEDGKERRHSHTIVSMTDSGTPPQLPSPTSTPPATSGKAPLTNVVAPTPSAGTPRMTRSNSIPTQEAAFDLYAAQPLGSPVSLVDRPKSMIRSGSFREPGDDVHGSVLSLASSASSNYSSAEERIQGEQIRKLRRELESSQEKVACLTTQLSANANLVAAFEQSLALMTSRLQSLSFSAEQKDSELMDLRETIEILKTKNTEAQAIIQGALNNPDNAPKELRIKRQNSSESISSLNSITSHSSVGSCKDTDAKKKKKKSWLRSSFNKAFNIKKGPKSATSYSDIEEIATPDSSAPSSPKLSHDGVENTPMSLKSSTSASSSVIFEGNEEVENDEKVVSDLRSELWEKERKLTDIRLEALNSAHQLEQLQEAMTNMQMTVENLKAENDQLKIGPPSTGPSSSTSQPSGLMSLVTSSQRQSMSASVMKSFSLSQSGEPDIAKTDATGLLPNREETRLRVVVHMTDQRVLKDEVKQQNFFIGFVKASSRMDWALLDTAVSQAFKDYVSKVDPTTSLGLSTDSIYSYQVNHSKRVLGTEAPELPPFRTLSKGPGSVTVVFKGLKEKCVDNLVFETLIPKPMMQHYISLLLKHRRLIMSGPSGTGKTYLSSRLAEYLVERSGREVTEGIVVTYNMHRQSCKDLQLYLSNLANQIDRETSTGDVPLVILLDDISDAVSISELVNGALTCKYHKCPYIIGTTNQPVKMTPNHGLHLSFRMVTFSNNVEPANGFLVRYLHRKLMEAENESSVGSEDLLRVLDWVPKLWYHLHTFLEKHSTSDFLIGPCFFLSCPVTVEEFRSWFIDLWNHSIIPYLQEGAKDGIKVHGQKAVWEDPVEWVRGTLPWPSAQQDQAKLFHLPPPSLGPDSPGQPTEERPKETPPSSLESDPLMAMLLKLQEAANYIESPEQEMATDPSLHSTL